MCLSVVIGCTERTAVERTDPDSQLESARRDGKIVMLELGSLGCIPCENMEPVMEQVRNNYGNRLEVYQAVRQPPAGFLTLGVLLIIISRLGDIWMIS